MTDLDIFLLVNAAQSCEALAHTATGQIAFAEELRHTGIAGAALLRRALPDIVDSNAGTVARLRMQARLIAAAAKNIAPWSQLASHDSPALRRVLDERPDAIAGALIWPWLNAGWDTPERLNRIGQHYRVVDRLGGPLPFGTSESLVLADLSEIWPGLRVVLDQPVWFRREGGLTLNLFIEDFRAYSVTFAFSEAVPGRAPDLLIGSVQGRAGEAMRPLYCDLTKAAHGIRPRDLLIAVLQMLGRYWGAGRILAIRDSHRYQRHSFFGDHPDIRQDYDVIWRERDGVPEDDAFFRLPLIAQRRSPSEIKPNKRALYSRRYTFLDALEARLMTGFANLEPVRITDR